MGTRRAIGYGAEGETQEGGGEGRPRTARAGWESDVDEQCEIEADTVQTLALTSA